MKKVNARGLSALLKPSPQPNDSKPEGGVTQLPKVLHNPVTQLPPKKGGTQLVLHNSPKMLHNSPEGVTQLPQEARDKMSQKKRGSNNPNFKGYICCGGLKYSSLREAAEASNLSHMTIKRYLEKGLHGWSLESVL